MGRGKICPRRIASAPPSCRLGLGDTPNPPGPRAPPLRRPPPRALGGGGVGEALTSQEASANRSCPSRAPKGFPGHSRDLGRDPAGTTLTRGSKGGRPAPGRGDRGWDPPERGGTGVPAQARLLRPRDGQRGRESHSGQRAGARTGARGRRGGLPFPRRRPRQGRAQPLPISGPSGPPGPPGPCDPGPQPGRAGHEVSVPRAPAKPALDSSRVGSGRELSAAQPAAQRGKPRPRGAGLRLKSESRRMLLALVTLGEALPLPGSP